MLVAEEVVTVGALFVAGNAAVITPELAEFVALVEPAIVNWLAVTPVRVYPVVADSVIVAV